MLLTGGASIVGLACMLAVGVAVSGTGGAIAGTVVGMTLAACRARCILPPSGSRARAAVDRAR